MAVKTGRRLLVTGASGFLGWNICRNAPASDTVIGVGNNNTTGLSSVDEVRGDLTDKEFLTGLFSRYRPDAVIHTAAAADPNFCQQNPEASAAINIIATVTLARHCTHAQIPFLFTSTDLVFDGKHPPYNETAPIGPLNLYGQQKAAAENELLKLDGRIIVCRMPLMYGDAPPHAKSFIHPMIATLREGRRLALFTDEYRTPLSARDAAAGILLLLYSGRTGIFHLGGPQRLSRFATGTLLAEAIGCTARIVPCRQKDVPMAAPRAADVSLNSTRAAAEGFSPRRMGEVLPELECIRSILPHCAS